MKTQYPWLASSGEAACQLSSWFANVPFTRMTGSGWADDGLHLKLSAPGGGVCGNPKPASAPAAKSQLTGSVRAWADSGAATSAAPATSSAAAARQRAGQKAGMRGMLGVHVVP